MIQKTLFICIPPLKKNKPRHDKIGFIKGFIGGICRSAISYPLDTLKILSQTNSKIPLNISRLYRGIATQLLTNAFLGGMIIETEERVYEYTFNHTFAGFISGASSSLISIPIDFIKLQRQCNNISLRNIIKMNPYVGWQSAFFREAAAGAIFFTVFHALKEKKQCNKTVSASIAGFTTVIISHPFDVIKTRLQLGNTIHSALSMGNFGAGIHISCGKSILMNFISYYIMSRM